jgi:DNA-binding SARP family transcriptional activator/tetratricopeptide (TPR) repeat protein
VTLEVGVLGPFSLRVHGAQVDVPSRRQRALLAALALRAGEAVTTDSLGDLVWAEQAPKHVASSMYTLVNRLRQLIGGDLVRTEPDGYLLDVPPESVDALRMRQLVARAETETPARARELLDEALALWRGPPLRDCGSDRLEREMTPLLVERYLTALERSVDLDAAAGQPARLVAELRATAAGHPLREPLWARLITVLAADGLQAEALMAYQTITRRLADELGVDPSAELRAAHARVLSGQQTATVPRQLPPGIARFVGRTAHLTTLDRLLADWARPVTIIAVHGPGGIGKTSLALRWARQVSGRFPDGQLYVDMRGYGPDEPMTPTAALGTVLRSVGMSHEQIPADLAARSALLRTHLAGRRMLLLVDNVRDSDQVRPLLPGNDSLVLVTSRNELRGLAVRDGAYRVALAEMTSAEARDVIAAAIGAARVEAEPAMVTELVDLCGRLPLALVVAAERAARYPGTTVGELVAELRASEGRLTTLADPSDPAVDPRAVFSWSYRALPADTARAFRYLGLHPAPEISMPAAVALIGVPEKQARVLLDMLVSVHLLEHEKRDRYRFHDLLWVYAAERALDEDAEADRHAAIRRMTDWYLYSAHEAAHVFYPHRLPIDLAPDASGIPPARPATFEDALDWLTTELQALLGVVRLAGEAGFGVQSWQLAWTVGDFLDRQGYWHDNRNVQRLGLASAERVADRLGQAKSHGGLARVATRLGEYADAVTHLDAALDLYVQIGDAVAQSVTHRNLAWVLELMNRYPEALAHAEQGLELVQRSGGNPAALGLALNGVGYLHDLVGNYEQALAYVERALEINLAAGDHRGQATTWDNLAGVHHHLGHYDKAVACYEQALEFHQSLESRYEEAEVLAKFGETHLALGDVAAARDVWRAALRILGELAVPADHPMLATIRANLRDIS